MSIAYLYEVLPGVRIRSACSGAGKLYVCSNANAYKYDLLTGKLDLTSQSIATQPDSLCLVNSASALGTCTGTTSAYLIELSSGFVATITGGRALPNTDKGQQSDSDGNGTVFACSSTNNEVTKYTTFALSHVTPSGSSLASAQALTIINKTGSSNFLLGTNNGKIIEIDSSGTTIQTITLPTTPNVGTAPVLQVSGLSYYNDNLFVMTNFGVAYHYKYSTSTLYNKHILGATNSGAALGSALCASACGVTLMGQNILHSAATASITQIDFNYSPALITDVFFNETNNAVMSSGIDTTTHTAWIANVGTINKGRVFSIYGIGQTAETTRIQASNVDVSGRIIRIRDVRPGCSRVEIDQSVSAGSTNLAASAQASYVEAATRGTPGSDETADLRVFNS